MSADLWKINNGVYLGYGIDDAGAERRLGESLTYTGDRHICLIGNSGAGKSRRWLVPNLAKLTGWSILVIDPKGELVQMCAPHRAAAGSENIVFDPFGLSGSTSTGLNHLTSLEPASDTFPDDAAEQAEALIQVSRRDNPHWGESAQDFITGLAMYTRLIIPGGSYADVRALLTLPDERLRALVMGGADLTPATRHEWQQSRGDKETEKAFDEAHPGYNPPFEYRGKLLPGMIAAGIIHNWEEIGHKAQRFAAITPESREMHSILSTGITQTRLLDSRAIKRELAGGGPSFREMKQRPMTVWLVLPDRRLGTHARWLRLTLTLAIQALMSDTRPGRVPVGIICDDAAALGHLPILERTVAQLRGYGIKLITIWQDLAQLKHIYGDRWETFIGNSGVLQSFSAQDVVTAQYLSDRSGMTTEQAEARNISLNLHKKHSYSTSSTRSPFQKPLLLPQDIRNMEDGETVIYSDRLKGAARAYLPFPSELRGFDDICARDPARR